MRPAAVSNKQWRARLGYAAALAETAMLLEQHRDWVTAGPATSW